VRISLATNEAATITPTNPHSPVSGPNLASSFHPIGSVWDEVYSQGAVQSRPHRNVQTTPVQPGSCTVATMHYPAPGPDPG
jgi:nitrite reductase (NO-forming)